MKSIFAIIISIGVVSLPGTTPVAAAATDAAKVMADLRNALGGGDKLAAVRTLTAVGIQRRMAAKGTSEGDIELALELPDKFIARTALTNLGSMSTYLTTGFNGDDAIYLLDAPPNLSGGAAKSKAAFGKAGGNGKAESVEDKALATEKAVLAAKQDFARVALGLLGSSYASFPLQFTYVAEAESPDGTAHVIEARGAGAFEVRLFVDTKSSLPLMMQWTQVYPAAKGTGPKEVVQTEYYSDFRKVGDLIVAHRLQRSASGQPTEDVLFEKIRINTKIDGKRFAAVK